MAQGFRLSLSVGHSWMATWLGVLAGTVMAISVISVWYVVNERAHEHIELSSDHSLRVSQLLIRQDIDNRISALERLAQRWPSSGAVSRSAWEDDVTRYVIDMPGFQAIEWADASFRVQWVVPSAGNESLQGQDIPQTEFVRAALASVKDSDTVILTEPFEISQGELGIAVYIPLTRDGRFDGMMVGILRLEAWLTDIVGAVQSSDYQARILLQGHEVYRYDVDSGSIDESRTERSEFETHGLTWTMLITPTSAFLSAGHAESSSLVLIVGLLLSALVAVAVYLLLAGRIRSRQLHDAATQLETLIQSLPGIAYRRGNQANWPVEFVSSGCSKLTGYSYDDFEEKRVSWGDLIHPDDRDRIQGQMQDAVDATEMYELEYRLITRDQQERWMWERGRAVYSESSERIVLQGFITDISDRKHTEVALVEARAFSEAIVETAADAIITIDANSMIENFNRAAQEMFGYSLHEVLGKDVSMLMPDTYRSEHDQSVARSVGTESIPVARTGREVIAQRKDGSVFPIYLSISEVRGRPERKFVGLIRDISGQRAAENEARQHRENLAHIDRLNMLGEMATGIAHEINQPLTAISLFAIAGGRLLADGKKEKLPDIFEKLSKHAHRASAVIERMQNMARRRESAKELIDCNELIAEVAKLAETEARIRDMVITVEAEDGLPAVTVDIVQVQQVILNLLRNGMEAMQSVDCRNGNLICLQSRRHTSGEIEVAVTDSGSGVSEDIAERIFAPFSTTKKSGMGMGLSISRSIITAHGGQLDFYNNDSGGATFFFTLPVVDQDEQSG